MRNLFLFFLCVVIFSNSFAQQVNISGKADFLKDGDTLKVNQQHLSRMSPGIALSTLVKNGAFTFSFNQESTECYTLSYHRNSKFLFLDTGNVQIDLIDSTLQKATLKGSTITNDEFDVYSRMLSENEAGSKFANARKKFFLTTGSYMDTSLYAKIKPEMDSLLAVYKQAKVNNTVGWVKAHPNSQINSYILVENTMGIIHTDGILPGDKLKAVFNALPDEVKKNS